MNPLKSLVEYLKSVNSELRKVSWPSRRDTIRYSALVIGISIVTALFFAGLDYGFSQMQIGGIALRNALNKPPAAQTSSTTATSSTPATSANSTGTPSINFDNVTPITTPASATQTKTVK